MKSLCWMCCLVFAASIGYGQTLVEQALEAGRSNDFKKASRLYLQVLKEAQRTENDALIYDTYDKLATCYVSLFKLDSCILIFAAAERFAKNRDDYDKYCEFKMSRAEVRFIQGEHTKAYTLFHEIVQDDRTKSNNLIRSHMRLADLYNAKSDSSEAFHHIEIALGKALEVKDSAILGNIYNTYAGLESEYGSAYRAIDLYQQAIPYFKKNKHLEFRLSDLNRQISYLFQTLGNVDKALRFCYIALESAEKYKSKNSAARAESLLGELLLKNKDYEMAKDYFSRALVYFLKKNKKNQICNLHGYLAEVAMHLDNQKEAREHLDAARNVLYSDQPVNSRFYYYQREAKYGLKYGTRLNRIKQVIDSCRMIADQSDNEYLLLHTLNLEVAYFKKTKNYKAALMAREQHADQIIITRQKNQSQLVHDLEAKYQNEMLDKELVQLSTLNLLNESKLTQQKLIIYSTIAALIAMGLFGFFFYRLYKTVAAQNVIIDQALDEKELLLREIHHRVKNNLQVISSLLSLQSGYIDDDKAIEALKHGQDRVRSMALIHQDLYKEDNLKGVNAKKYIESLTDNLFESYQINDREIDLKIDVSPLVLDVDTMIPLGLVVNELMSNVLKHAFVDQPHGKVSLTLKEINDKLFLEIKDNGVGIDNMEALTGDTFGFQMIQAFASKLKADIQVQHENGLNISLLINNYAKSA